MATKINPDQLLSEVNKILDKETTQVVKKTKKIVTEVSDKTVNKLKETSPKGKGKGSGQYAKSWKAKKTKEDAMSIEYCVHAGKYQLTHLLENGHLIRNGTGRTFGFTQPKPHIKKAEEMAVEEIYKEIKAAI